MKHFLFITALGMLIGSAVFVYLGLQRSKSSTAHTAVFLAAAVSCMSYYSMATGLGVEYKTVDQSPRVIFLTRYIDQLVTSPLVLLVLASLAKFENWGVASLLGTQVPFCLHSLTPRGLCSFRQITHRLGQASSCTGVIRCLTPVCCAADSVDAGGALRGAGRCPL